MTTTAGKLMTADELFALGDTGRCELIYGELVKMSPSGFDHGRIAATIASLLRQHVQPRKSGYVLGAETGFLLERNPDLLRAPDVAFVRAERVTGSVPTKYFDGAPDLAVEIVSPSDPWPEVEAKVETWLSHGTSSVWVVDPRSRRISHYRPDGSVVRLAQHEELRDDVLPGFAVAVVTVFE